MDKNDEIKSRKKCNKQKKEKSLILQSLIQITLYKQDSPDEISHKLYSFQPER